MVSCTLKIYSAPSTTLSAPTHTPIKSSALVLEYTLTHTLSSHCSLCLSLSFHTLTFFHPLSFSSVPLSHFMSFSSSHFHSLPILILLLPSLSSSLFLPPLLVILYISLCLSLHSSSPSLSFILTLLLSFSSSSH